MSSYLSEKMAFRAFSVIFSHSPHIFKITLYRPPSEENIDVPLSADSSKSNISMRSEMSCLSMQVLSPNSTRILGTPKPNVMSKPPIPKNKVVSGSNTSIVSGKSSSQVQISQPSTPINLRKNKMPAKVAPVDKNKVDKQKIDKQKIIKQQLEDKMVERQQLEQQKLENQQFMQQQIQQQKLEENKIEKQTLETQQFNRKLEEQKLDDQKAKMLKMLEKEKQAFLDAQRLESQKLKPESPKKPARKLKSDKSKLELTDELENTYFKKDLPKINAVPKITADTKIKAATKTQSEIQLKMAKLLNKNNQDMGPNSTPLQTPKVSRKNTGQKGGGGPRFCKKGEESSNKSSDPSGPAGGGKFAAKFAAKNAIPLDINAAKSGGNPKPPLSSSSNTE